MKIRFIFHSSYLVELPQAYLLFDYYQGELPVLSQEKPLLVLASHGHYDHFSPDVFQLTKKYPDCTFLLSDDISRELVKQAVSELGKEPRILRVHAGDHLEMKTYGIRIEAFPSTDLGVSFLVSTEDRLIFHAGDLNDWAWTNASRSRNEQMHQDFLDALTLLKERIRDRRLDILILPMDPVLGTAVYQGPLEYLEKIPARHIFPMHMWEQYSIGERFIREHPAFQDRFHPISRPGEEFMI